MRKALFLLLVLISACKFTTVHINDIADKKEAEKVTDQFFYLISRNKSTEAMKLFQPLYFWVNDTVELRAELNDLAAKTPHLKEHKLDHWDTKVLTGLEADPGLDSKDRYDFYYLNTYEGGKEYKISITLTKDLTDDILISSFGVSADKFQ